MTTLSVEPHDPDTDLVAPTTRLTNWRDGVVIALAILIFSTLSIWMGYASESDLEADATTHFMMARFALHEHHYLTSVWGRPLCTAAYCLTARLGTVEQGRFGARLTSLAMAIFVAMVTYIIARRQDIRRPALVVILLLAQPLFFLHSFSQLTEIPFDVVLMLAFLAYQRRQWFWMALLTGMLPLGRPEGFGFIVMAATALLAHRRARWLWLLAVPYALWNYAGFYIANPKVPSGAGAMWWIFNTQWPMWVIHQWPYSYESVYGRGPLFSFVGRLPVLIGPLTFPFVMLGVGLGIALLHTWKTLKTCHPEPYSAKDLAETRRLDASRSTAQHDTLDRSSLLARFAHRLRDMPHAVRCEIWIAIIPMLILAVHSLLWWRGKMGSNGELRYLVIVGPFFALAGARGWEWVWSRYRFKAPLLFAGIAAVLPIFVNFFWRVVPFHAYEQDIVSKEVADWYSRDASIRAAYPRIMPTPPGVLFYMDLSQTDSTRVLAAGKGTVKLAPPGSLLIWDAVYGENNSSADMCVTPDEIKAAGWIYYTTFAEGTTSCDVYLSPKTIDGKTSVLPANDPNATMRLFTVPMMAASTRRP